MNIKGTDFIFYNVTDLVRSTSFFRDILRLKVTDQKDFWVEFETGNMTLAIGNYDAVKDNGKRKNSVAVVLSVDDVAKAVEYLKTKGVKVMTEASNFANCSMALILDPDGNEIVLHHRKDDTVG